MGVGGTIYNNYTLEPFFFWWCNSYGPQQGPDRQQKKEEGGLKQRRKQAEEAAQGDPEPGKGNQEKEKDPSRIQS
jgi:hypothetical protein